MKKRFFLLLSVAATLVLGNVAAAFPEDQPIATTLVYPVSKVGEHVVRGTPRVAVSFHLGNPDRIIDDNTWVYHGFQLKPGQRAPRDYRSIVIRFDSDKVTMIRLVNRDGLASIVKMAQADASAHVSARERF